MWPSSLTCYLQWLNKCVFVMAKKSPDEPQTACINSILPGTITNASELFCIRRKDNAKHFWKHCHPSNSQHIPLQHTCRRKNTSEHKRALISILLPMPHSHGPTPCSHALVHTLVHALAHTLPHALPHTMSPHYVHKLWPHTMHECGWQILMIRAFDSLWMLQPGTGFLYALQVRITAIFHDSYGIAFTFLPPMASSYARRRSKLWI